MKLQECDGRCVRIVDGDGKAFEGVCAYNGAEYDEHEFGRGEDSLQMESFLFFRGDIRLLSLLEDRGGPYGPFSGPYGTLEEMTAADGADSVCEALLSEEDVHVRRMLAYLEDNGGALPWRGALPEALRQLATTHPDARIRAQAARLLRESI